MTRRRRAAAPRRGRRGPYRRAELHRLRGESARPRRPTRASQWDVEPSPGLALLRLAQGRVEAAAAAIRRAVDEARTRSTGQGARRVVEIAFAARRTPAARTAADELAALAIDAGRRPADALAAQALARVLLAEGDVSRRCARCERHSPAWR